MLNITSELIKANSATLTQFDYLIVQHFKNDTVEFVKQLYQTGCRISHIIGISYSVDETALESLRELKLRVEVRDFAQLSEYLLDMISRHARPVVLLDVGGYGSDAASNLSTAKKLRFVVEDTNNGLWRYQSMPLCCPVIDVASIENKSVENAFAGRRIVDGIHSFFSESGIAQPEEGYVVIGFGGIGQGVCAALALRGINAAVVELDDRKLAVAEALGHDIGRSITDFRNAKLVVGCTGVSSVDMTQLRCLSERPILVSGSSKRVEFQNVLKTGTISQLMGSNALVEASTGAIVVNNGEPINLRYGSLNNETGDFMFANITAGIVEGSQAQGSKVFRLSERRQIEICRLWAKHYLRRKAETD